MKVSDWSSTSSTETHIAPLVPCRLGAVAIPTVPVTTRVCDLTKLAPIDVNDAALPSTDDDQHNVAVGELQGAEAPCRPRVIDVLRPLVIHQLRHQKRQQDGRIPTAHPGRGDPPVADEVTSM